MITESLFSAMGALILVIGLMFLMLWAVRKLGLVPGYVNGEKGKKARIKVLETRMLDPRNRLVLVSLDDREFLLASGQSGVRLISGNGDGQLFSEHLDRIESEEASDA